MRLAASVGRLDWENVLDEISLEELIHWRTLDALEGIGWKRDDMRTAHQTACLISAHVGVELPPLRHDLDGQSEG